MLHYRIGYISQQFADCVHNIGSGGIGNELELAYQLHI